ncbi:MAG: DUF6348 family protein [Capsulimonadales bacterium]|nr:DUF6348 family protein [Capsulimonadales bacterium]
MDNATLNAVALEAIRRQLEGQGLSPRPVEKTLLLGVDGLLCRCEVLAVPPDLPSAIVPVGVEVILGESGRVIREVMVGFSEDRQDAVVQAMHNWAEGVFPPIRHACASSPEKDSRVEVCRLSARNVVTGETVDWKVILGLTQVGGWNKEVTAGVIPTETLLRSLANPLTSVASDPRLHWVKVYLARQPDGEKVLECKRDNKDWAEGRSALRRLPLPRDSHFVHLRRFLVLHPAHAAIREGECGTETPPGEGKHVRRPGSGFRWLFRKRRA